MTLASVRLRAEAFFTNGDDFMSSHACNGCSSAIRDTRRVNPKHTHFLYELPTFDRVESWQKRAQEIRQRICLAGGLMPLPARNPLNPTFEGQTILNGVVIDKIRFESMPGFYCTGTLYRPQQEGMKPAVLCPHGHWTHGRLQNDHLCATQQRCYNLARMGFVVFSHDMVGYCDSHQIPHSMVTEAEKLWCFNLFGLQLWNNIRALDFICALPEVDPKRIGVTGESGGGTQTFTLAAIDDRVAASMPVVMVSEFFQGGCCCENTPQLRGDDIMNPVIAAAYAPKPMMVTGCTGDWTKNLLDVVGPWLKGIYGLFGAEDQISFHMEDEEHNYNAGMRKEAYKFFSRVLMGKEIDWQEETLEFGRGDILRLFPEESAGGRYDDEIATDFRLQLFAKRKKEMVKDAAKWLREDMQSLLQAHEMVIGLPDKIACRGGCSHDGVRQVTVITDQGAAIPLQIKAQKGIVVALLVHHDGIKAAFEDEMLLQKAAGWDLAALDLPFVGEHTLQVDEIPEDVRDYYLTFNPTDDMLRVRDIVAVGRALFDLGFEGIKLIGTPQTEALIAAALPHIPMAVAGDICKDELTDVEYLEKLHIPGLPGLGGVSASLHMAKILAEEEWA